MTFSPGLTLTVSEQCALRWCGRVSGSVLPSRSQAIDSVDSLRERPGMSACGWVFSGLWRWFVFSVRISPFDVFH